MPADPYALCPCGSGKKLKFCCGPHWPDIEKIERLFDSQQDLAALDAIAKLEPKLPRHPHLMNMKIDLLYAQGKREEAELLEEEFIAEHPDNLNAQYRQAAMQVEEGEIEQGFRQWYRTFAGSGGTITNTGVIAARAIVSGALMAGRYAAGRALLNILLAIDPKDDTLRSSAVQLMSDADQPPLCRELLALRQQPVDPRWADDFKAALDPTTRANFPEAEALFTALSEKAPQEPAVWANLAVLRGMLADLPGVSEAYARLAECDVSWDEVVEAEALSVIHRQDAPGQIVEILNAAYEVTDVDRVLELLSADKRFVRLPTEMLHPGDENTPPARAAFQVLDRPRLSDATNVTVDDVPLIMADFAMYGKETDRPARFMVVAMGQTALEQVVGTLRDVTKEALPSWGERTIVDSVLLEQQVLNWRIHLPESTSVDRYYDLQLAHQREAIRRFWPETPNVALDGQSPRSVVGLPAWRRRLAATVLLLELAHQSTLSPADFAPLREDLRLEPPAAIDPTTKTADGQPIHIPVMRLTRVDATKYSDDELIGEIERASAYGATGAIAHLGTEALRRGGIAGQTRMRVLLLLSRSAADSRLAVKYLQEIQRLAVQAKTSPAPFLVMELRLRITRREPDELQRVMQTLLTRHSREPGVAQAVGAILQELGLLGPDGRPVPQPESGPLAAPAEEPGKLWTPESAAAGPAKSGLWVPGMD